MFVLSETGERSTPEDGEYATEDKIYVIGVGCKGKLDIERIKAEGVKGIESISGAEIDGDCSTLKIGTIYGEKEVRARYEILLENYSKVIAIEAQTMINMAKKYLIIVKMKHMVLKRLMIIMDMKKGIFILKRLQTLSITMELQAVWHQDRVAMSMCCFCMDMIVRKNC